MRKLIPILPICIAAMAVNACEMYAPSIVNDRRVQVREERFSEELSIEKLNNDYIAGVAQNYGNSGMGPINLTITYDPASKRNTAMRASDQAVRVSQELRKQGVKEVVTNILPVREQGEESTAIVSYSAYQAAAPANCGTMPGMESTILELDHTYRLGCSVETVFAKQIADPSDLLGDARPTAYTDGRPTSNKIDAYRSGAQNKDLGGESASD